MDEHNDGCLCAICRWKQDGLTETEANAKFVAWEEAQIEKHGWLAHYIGNDQSKNALINCHTHGLLENFAHPDLQLVIPLPGKIAHGIFVSVVDLIKEGFIFSAGDFTDRVVKNYKVKFVDAFDEDRPVLRIIVPDVKGNLEKGKIGGGLAIQYSDLS